MPKVKDGIPTYFPGLTQHIPDHVGNGYMWVIPEQLGVDLDAIIASGEAGWRAVEALRYKSEAVLDLCEISIYRSDSGKAKGSGWAPYKQVDLDFAVKLGATIKKLIDQSLPAIEQVRTATRLLITFERSIDYLDRHTPRWQINKLLDGYADR